MPLELRVLAERQLGAGPHHRGFTVGGDLPRLHRRGTAAGRRDRPDLLGARQDRRPAGLCARAAAGPVATIAPRGAAAAGVPTAEHYMDLGSWFAGAPGRLVDLLEGFGKHYPGI
jgi:hypothetical protein